jgi:hypothetical protein
MKDRLPPSRRRRHYFSFIGRTEQREFRLFFNGPQQSEAQKSGRVRRPWRFSEVSSFGAKK